MQTTKAIQAFLSANANPSVADLLARWSPDMETQVLTIKGEPVAGRRSTYSDGVSTWWDIRIPKKADSEPNWNDYELTFPLEEKAEAIGSTGWDWQARVSRWVGFDFDSITQHAAGVGISDEQLAAVVAAAHAVPWLEIRKSTRGKGLHLYVRFEAGVPTANHTEHAALARAILGMLSAETGFDFGASVDTCGGNLWIWHRGATEDGFALIKAAVPLETVPPNWRDHLDVVKRRRTRAAAGSEEVEELAATQRRTPLDDKHKALIEAVRSAGFAANWLPDHHLLQTHTCGLASASAALELPGVFATNSRGSDPATPNCFAFPIPDGAWRVYRFGTGTVEHPSWTQDGGWTNCCLGQRPDIGCAASIFQGHKSKDGGYFFDEFAGLAKAARSDGRHRKRAKKTGQAPAQAQR